MMQYYSQRVGRKLTNIRDNSYTSSCRQPTPSLWPGFCTAHNVALLMKSRSEPCLKFTKEDLRKPDEIPTGIIFITLIRPRQRYLASFHIKFGRKRTTNGRRNVILWDCFSSHTTGRLHRFKGRKYQNTYILNKTLLHH